jgi:hypothetical protein
MNIRFPSVKRIAETLRVSVETAKRVRGLMDGSIDPETSAKAKDWIRCCYHRPSNFELIMCAIDDTLGTHGVETIQGKWIDSFHQNIQAEYCNTGDTYAATVLLCHKRDRFMLTSYGDYVEHNRL